LVGDLAGGFARGSMGGGPAESPAGSCVAPLPLLVVEALVDVAVEAAVVEFVELVELVEVVAVVEAVELVALLEELLRAPGIAPPLPVVALVESVVDAGVVPPVMLMETCLGEPELSSMSTVTLQAIPANANQASIPTRDLILMREDTEQPRCRGAVARKEAPRGALRENLRNAARASAQPLVQFFCCGLRFGVFTSVDSSTPERTSILMPSLIPNATSRCSKRFGPVTTSTKGLSPSN